MKVYALNENLEKLKKEELYFYEGEKEIAVWDLKEQNLRLNVEDDFLIKRANIPSSFFDQLRIKISSAVSGSV